MSIKQIILYKSKHADLLFDVSTKSLEEKAYLALFKIMKDFGYYNDLERLKEPANPGFNFEQIHEFNEGEIKKKAFQVWENYQEELEDYDGVEKLKTYYEGAKKGNKNDLETFLLLRKHNGYAYENWEVHSVEN